MKKITTLITAFILLLCAGSVTYAQETQRVVDVPLGNTAAQVEEMLGKPLTESARDGLTIWWYTSIDPLQADFVYFRDDRVVMTSIFSNGQTLETATSANGFPEESLYRFAPGIEDPLLQVVHIWPGEGKSAITSGTTLASPVIRENTFSPLTLSTYYSLLGAELVGNQKVTVAQVKEKSPVVNETGQPTEYTRYERETDNTSTMFGYALGILVIILAIVGFYYLRFRKSRQSV